MGLIPTLLRDGLRRQVSTIAGRRHCDFMWLEDVGRYIALDIYLPRRDGEARSSTSAAADRQRGRGEILRRRYAQAPSYVVFSGDHANTDITFSPHLLPPDWRRSICPKASSRHIGQPSRAVGSHERGRIGLTSIRPTTRGGPAISFAVEARLLSTRKPGPFQACAG